MPKVMNSRAYRMYNKRTKAVMKSINVEVDDYLPPSDTSRLKDPPMVSVHEEKKTLNSPKDASLSCDEENDPVFIDV